MLSNPSSVIENDKLRREEEEKLNKERVEIPVEEEQPKLAKKDLLGTGLNKDKFQKEIIELRKKSSKPKDSIGTQDDLLDFLDTRESKEIVPILNKNAKATPTPVKESPAKSTP